MTWRLGLLRPTPLRHSSSCSWQHSLQVQDWLFVKEFPRLSGSLLAKVGLVPPGLLLAATSC